MVVNTRCDPLAANRICAEIRGEAWLARRKWQKSRLWVSPSGASFCADTRRYNSIQFCWLKWLRLCRLAPLKTARSTSVPPFTSEEIKMPINGIPSSTSNIPPLNAASSSNQGARIGTDRDGDNDGGRVSRPSGGGLASAVNQALSQIGVSASSGSAATGSTTPTPDPMQASSAFMHNLFAALQSQGSGQPRTAQGGADSDGDNDGGSTSGVSGATGGGRHHGGGAGSIASKLQSLIQQLSASSQGTSNSTPTSLSTSASGATDPALTALQQSFQDLLSAQGVSGSQATLGSFLQALAQDLPGTKPTGNIVQAQA